MKIESFITGFVVMIMILLIAALLFSSCRPAEFDSANWKPLGDQIYWRQFTWFEGVDCVVVRGQNHDISVDCFEVTR